MEADIEMQEELDDPGSEGLHLPSNNGNIHDDSQEHLLDEYDNLYQIGQYRNHFSDQLIGYVYQLDFSVLCLLRKFMHSHEYPSLSISFEDTEIDKFGSIVLHYENKSIHIQVEHVDQSCTDNNINFAALFSMKKQTFSINSYFESFVKCAVSRSDHLLNSVEYIIIYTNSGLDLTEKKKLKQARSRHFFPFKFDSIDIEKCQIFKDFLCVNGNTNEEVCFYQFSQDRDTREELLQRLHLSSIMQKAIRDKKLPEIFEKEIKEQFLNKLVLAVNQPNREELTSIMKNEINDVKCAYMQLQETMMYNLAGKLKLGIMYEFHLLLSILHDTFLNKKNSFVNCSSSSASNFITIYFKGKPTYIKACDADKIVTYNQFFPSKQQERKEKFSINNNFALFIKESQANENMKFFIIFTNADLELADENRLKKDRTKEFHPFKMDAVDIQKNRYKVLRNCSYINTNGLYKFAQEETETLIQLLKLPLHLQEGKEKLSEDMEREIKEIFLHKLILAVKQPSKEELNIATKIEINKSDVPYDYEELHEMTLRWSESHKSGPITKRTMRIILDDIKNNRSSYQKIQKKDIGEEIMFAKSVTAAEGTTPFNQFLDFLTKGEGKNYLAAMKSEGVKLASVSTILHKTGSNAPKALKDLYDLWFDEDKNKTKYLTSLQKNGVNLATMSSILKGARTSAASAFKDLYDLWFDEQGNKTHYLQTVEKGINITNMSGILNGAGSDSAKTFKELYDIWFDEEGNKTQYLKSLEKHGICVSSILHGAGAEAVKAFKELYNLWFDEAGNKTIYLQSLEKAGIDLISISSILNGAGLTATETFKTLYDFLFDKHGRATKYLKALQNNSIDLGNMLSFLRGSRSNSALAFKNLYYLWFDDEGNKTQLLKTLEEEGMNLVTMSSLVSGAGSNAPKAFTNLYNLWFDQDGNKTHYLRVLEENEINLVSMFRILRGAGSNAAKAFKDLYDLWFDKKGRKTAYLTTLEENGINVVRMSNVLNGVGTNGAKAFKGLHDLWFDEEENKTHYLRVLEQNGMSLYSLCSILSGVSGSHAVKSFKDLYNLWFDEEGKKTQYLTALEENGIKSSNIGILHRAGANASKAFKELYDTWFDEKGKKTRYLEILDKHEISLSSMCTMLSGAGSNAAKGFKDLHSLWFNEKGRKTQYLKALKKNNVNLSSMTTILHKAGHTAAKAFKELHNLWFDAEGRKTRYLRTLDEKSIDLTVMSGILHRSGVRAAKNFQELFNAWFDENGNKTKELMALERNGMSISDISSILHATGSKATKTFLELCSTFVGDNVARKRSASGEKSKKRVKHR